MTTERVSDERLRRCAESGIPLVVGEQKQVAGELLAAREVVKAAKGAIMPCLARALGANKETP